MDHAISENLRDVIYADTPLNSGCFLHAYLPKGDEKKAKYGVLHRFAMQNPIFRLFRPLSRRKRGTGGKCPEGV
jgi:hypothetical protein